MVSVQIRDVSRRRLGRDSVREDVPSAGECRRVSRVLLVATLHEHHADVECKGCHQEERDKSARKEDEDLAALAGATDVGAASC